MDPGIYHSDLVADHSIHKNVSPSQKISRRHSSCPSIHYLQLRLSLHSHLHPFQLKYSRLDYSLAQIQTSPISYFTINHPSYSYSGNHFICSWPATNKMIATVAV